MLTAAISLRSGLMVYFSGLYHRKTKQKNGVTRRDIFEGLGEETVQPIGEGPLRERATHQRLQEITLLDVT